MADASQLSQLKMDSKTTLKASDIRIHDFSLDTRGTAAAAGTDIMEQMARAARQTAQSHATGSFKNSAVDLDFSSLRADLGDEGPADRPLREAKRLLAQLQYEPALAKLEEVIAVAPDHPEATYLQAYCNYKLDRLKIALEKLRKLQGRDLTRRLQTCVRVLKEEMRQQTLPKAAQIYEAALKGKEVSKAIEQLRPFAEADPETGKFCCFLAGALLVGKRGLEARQVAAQGLEACETDREELQQLYQAIDQRCKTEVFEPARALYRAKNYPGASKALSEVPADFRGLPFWQAFHGYLERLNGKGGGGGFFAKLWGGGSAPHVPPGAAAVVRELYEFLVETELKSARSAISASNFAAAEKALAAALSYTPAFSLPNHMLATCVYQRVGASVKGKIGQELDESKARELRACQQQLDAVRPNAVISSQDAEIPDGARLLASLDEMRGQIEKVVEKYETQVHDAKLVNQCIDDFLQVLIQMFMLQGTKSPYEIRRIANDLYSKLSTMRGRLPDLRRQCRGDEARKIMDLLRDNFVEPNYVLLSRIMNR